MFKVSTSRSSVRLSGIEIQQLVGEKLDQEKAGQILGDINRELQPKYSAVKKVMKGSDPQHIVVIYDIHKARLIPFLDIPANQFVYNSKQNFSFDADIGFGKINRFYFGGYDDQDQLIERFAGFNLASRARRWAPTISASRCAMAGFTNAGSRLPCWPIQGPFTATVIL